MCKTKSILQHDLYKNQQNNNSLKHSVHNTFRRLQLSIQNSYIISFEMKRISVSTIKKLQNCNFFCDENAEMYELNTCI